MKCVSRFKRTSRFVNVRDAAIFAMEAIKPASNVVVKQLSNDLVEVEYDWPDKEPYFDATDVLKPLSIELVKDWYQERLR